MSAIIIKLKRLNKKAVIPKLMSDGAACMDLVATEIIHEDEDRVIVKYGFATEIPKGYKVVIAPRSGFTHKGWVMANSPGQVDSDYRGEWMSKFDAIPTKIDMHLQSGITYSLGNPEFPYKVGDRICQCWIEKVIDVEFNEVEEVNDTLRSSGGFGSTGT